LNSLVASGLKGLMNATGQQSEFIIKHLPRTGIIKVSLPNGQTLRLDTNGEDWIPTQLFWRGWDGYEPEITSLYYRLAEEARAAILDVGAHIGFFSLLGALANPKAQVYSFEPLDRVYERLELNIALNRLGNIRCFRAAVGETEGVQEFYFLDGDAPVASSLRNDMLLAHNPSESVRHVPVPVVTLDQTVEQHGIAEVSLIKLDTERTEHNVLAGCRRTLARDKPDIICEVWPDAGNQQQLEALLGPLGYRFYHVTASGPVERQEIKGDSELLSYLFSVRQM
jgi:FkbM family methyltransferase